MKLTSQAIRNAIVRDYLKGMSLGAAAKKHGCDPSVCRDELDRRGIAHRTASESHQLAIPKSVRDGMVKAYIVDRLTVQAASKLFGLGSTACLHELRRRGIPLRSKSQVIIDRISASERDEWIRLYISEKVSAYEIGRRFGYEPSIVTRELNRRGIEPRSLREASKWGNCNETFFDSIDCSAKAYLLGFITADGNVSRNQRTLNIGLALGDRGHLEKIAKAIEFCGRIYECEVADRRLKTGFRRLARISISSRKICSSLARLGVLPNKSLTVRACRKVPEQFLPDYYRGLIDGDGSISRRSKLLNGYYDWGIFLCGTRSIVSGFRNWVRTFLDARPKVMPAGNIFTVKFGGNRNVKAIVTRLYGSVDPSICLDRKLRLALEVMATKTAKPKLAIPTRQELNLLFQEHRDWQVVAKAIGISRTHLYKIRIRHKMPVGRNGPAQKDGRILPRDMKLSHAKIAKLYGIYGNWGLVAKAAGVDRTTLRKYRRLLGVHLTCAASAYRGR